MVHNARQQALQMAKPKRGRGRPPKNSKPDAKRPVATSGASRMVQKVQGTADVTHDNIEREAGETVADGARISDDGGQSDQEWEEEPVLPKICQQMKSLIESVQEASADDENDLVKMALIFFQAVMEQVTQRSIAMQIKVWAAKNSGKAFVLLPPTLSKLGNDPHYDVVKMLEAVKSFMQPEDIDPVAKFCSYLNRKKEVWLSDYHEAIREILPSEIEGPTGMSEPSSVSYEVNDHQNVSNKKKLASSKLVSSGSPETLDMQCEDVMEGPRTHKKSIRHGVLKAKPSLDRQKLAKNISRKPIGNSRTIQNQQTQDVDADEQTLPSLSLRIKEEELPSTSTSPTCDHPLAHVSSSDHEVSGELRSQFTKEESVNDNDGPEGLDSSQIDDTDELNDESVLDLMPVAGDCSIPVKKSGKVLSKRKADQPELNLTPSKRRRAVSSKMAEMMAELKFKEERKLARKQTKQSCHIEDSAALMKSIKKRYPVVELGRLYVKVSPKKAQGVVNKKLKENGDQKDAEKDAASDAEPEEDSDSSILDSQDPDLSLKQNTFPDDNDPALPENEWKSYQCRYCHLEGVVSGYADWRCLSIHIQQNHFGKLPDNEIGLECPFCPTVFSTSGQNPNFVKTVYRMTKHTRVKHQRTLGMPGSGQIPDSPSPKKKGVTNEQASDVKLEQLSKDDDQVEAEDTSKKSTQDKSKSALVPFPSRKYQSSLQENALKRKQDSRKPSFKNFLKMFSCPVCKEEEQNKYVTKFELIEHMNKQHIVKIGEHKGIKCEECEESFVSKSRYFQKTWVLTQYLEHAEEQHGKFCLNFIDSERWQAKLGEEEDLMDEDGEGAWRCFLCIHDNMSNNFTKCCLLVKHLLEDHRARNGLVTCFMCSWENRFFPLMKWDDSLKYIRHCILSHNMLHGSHLTDVLDMASVASIFRKAGKRLHPDHKLGIRYGYIVSTQTARKPAGSYFDLMKCFLCPEQNTCYQMSDGSYADHMMSHLGRADSNNTNGQSRCAIKCPQCDFSVVRLADSIVKPTILTYAATILLDHMVRDHKHATPDFTKIYVCMCGYETLLKYDYCEHATNYHKVPINTVLLRQCPVCDMELAPGVNWRQHRKVCEGLTTGVEPEIEEKSSPEKELCPECGQIFRSALSLSMHRWKSHKVNLSSEPPTACDKCGELVPNCFMTIHKYKHVPKKVQGSRVYCPECGLRCVNADSVLRHRWRIHKINGYHEPLVPCSACGKTMPPIFIQDHMALHDRIENQTSSKQGGDDKPVDPDMTAEPDENECSECGHMFSSQSNLRRHMWGMHGVNKDNEELVPCKLCMQLMPTSYLAAHKYRDHHPQTGELIPKKREKKKTPQNRNWDLPADNVCTMCNNKYANQSSLVRHMWRIHEVNAYNETLTVCELCGEKMPPSFMVVHKRKSHDPQTGATKRRVNRMAGNWNLPENNECKLCLRVYSNQASLVRHLWRIHQENVFNEAMVACELCGESMPLSFLSVHRSRYHVDINKVVKRAAPRKPPILRGTRKRKSGHSRCPDCGKFFSDEDSMKRHRWRMHKVNCFEAEMLPCVICGEMVPTSFRAAHEYQHARKLEQEQRKMEKKAKRARGENVIKALPYKCDICEKRVLNRYVLAQHKKKMHTDRPTAYECGFCGYTCREKKKHLMRNHLAIKHGIWTYLCKLCRFSVDTTEELAAHMQEKHPEGSDINYCPQCDKRFSSKRIYENHMFDVHKKLMTKRPVHQCPNCDFSSLLQKTVIDHIALSHEDLHVKCPVCQKSFFTQALCDTHMRIHDPNEKVKCEHCSYTTRSHKVLRYHMYNEHRILYDANDVPVSLAEEEEARANASASEHAEDPLKATVTVTGICVSTGEQELETSQLVMATSLAESDVASLQRACEEGAEDVTVELPQLKVEGQPLAIDEVSEIVMENAPMTSQIVQIIDEATGEPFQTFTLSLPEGTSQIIPTAESLNETVIVEDPNHSLLSGISHHAGDELSLVLSDPNTPSEDAGQSVAIPVSTQSTANRVEYVRLPGVSEVNEELLTYAAQMAQGGEEGVEYVFII